MSERESALRAQLWLAVIMFVAAGAMAIFVPPMWHSLALAGAFVAYRFGRLDEYRDSIKIN